MESSLLVMQSKCQANGLSIYRLQNLLNTQEFKYKGELQMNEKQRIMLDGMDKLLKRFNKFPNGKEFTVEEIIEISNEVYEEILNED